MRPAAGRPAKRARAQGFSLVEVLVSLLVLTIGLVGLTEAVGVAFRSSKDSELATASALLASSVIEEIRAGGILIEGEEEGDFGEEIPLYAWSRSIVETATAGLHEVTATVKNRRTDVVLREVKTLLFDVPLTTTLEGGSADQQARRGRRTSW